MMNMELKMIMEKQYRKFTIFLECVHTIKKLKCRCWISEEDGANWAFIAPMIAILSVSCYIRHYYVQYLHTDVCICAYKYRSTVVS